MKKTLLFIAAACLLMGCKSERHEYEWEWEDPVREEPQEPDVPQRQELNEDIVELGWTNVTTDFPEIPNYIGIYKSPSEMEGRKAIAYIAVADMSQAKFCVTSINDPNLQGTTEKLRTPSTAYEECGNPPVIINAGYFYTSGAKNYSASLVISDGKMLSPNINYASEDWITMYYPTRGVFLQHKDGKFEAGWSYYSTSGSHWFYSEPAPNKWGDTPCPVPSASYPVEAQTLEAVTGIGGGPVLLRKGEIRNTGQEELFDGSGGVNVNSPNNPRTSIGITADNRLILFVCEGREKTEGVVGFTTAEEANIMKSLGCVEALNLDGGGSTCMLVGGEQTIKPSDGTQRKVASLIYLK